MASDDDTAPIDLVTGQRRAFRRREVTHEIPASKPDDDAPTKRDRTPSALVGGLVDQVFSVARAEKPTDDQLGKLQGNLHALAILAEQGYQFAKGGGGGKSSGGAVNMLVTALVAAGVALGVPNLTGSNDALAEAIAGRIDATDDRLEQTDKRIGTLEDGQERLRYALGKTIEWQGQETFKACTRDELGAGALNWIAKRMPRDRDDEEPYKPIYVDCEQNPLLPTEMVDLQTHARRVDNER